MIVVNNELARQSIPSACEQIDLFMPAVLRYNGGMQITLRKHRDKAATLVCIRNDGSATWQNYGNQGGFFPIHDLTHFVVETELGYQHAFFGMAADGRDLNDFGPGDAASLHPEAIWAEMLAGLLTTVDGRGSTLSYNEIEETMDAKALELGVPPITLNERQLAAIRRKCEALAKEWESLRSGEALDLVFAPGK